VTDTSDSEPLPKTVRHSIKLFNPVERCPINYVSFISEREAKWQFAGYWMSSVLNTAVKWSAPVPCIQEVPGSITQVPRPVNRTRDFPSVYLFSLEKLG
jgi:hypothetical protein